MILNGENEETFRIYEKRIVDLGIEFKKRARPLEYRPTSDLTRFATRYEIGEEGCSLDDLVEMYQDLCGYSLNFSSPNFLAMPDCGHSVAGLLGQTGLSLLNQNTVNIESSPLASVIEIQLLQALRRLIGYPLAEDPATLAVHAGGAFTFGGYGSNLSCLLIAREALRRRLASEGKRYEPRRVRVLGSQAFAHYSLRRSLDILGLGNRDLTEEQLRAEGLERECLASVESINYRMDPRSLRQTIEDTLARGEEIMAVFAISGDSRAMAFDDLRELHGIASTYGLWLHVDGCQGGQCLFSQKRKSEVLQGIEDCNSISIDPHKTMMLPYNLSAYFVRDWRDLHLLPKGSTVISNDDDALGKFTPGVGSKAYISLKLHFVLRHWGLRRLAAEIERRHALACEAADEILADERLVLLNPEVQHNSVMFMVRPLSGHQDVAAFNRLNRSIHRRLAEDGNYFVHTFPTRDDSRVVTSDPSKELWPLRMMFGNPDTTLQHVKGCLDRIKDIALDLGDSE
jgi:L-2,4-diaminobutyrate decarboxylase